MATLERAQPVIRLEALLSFVDSFNLHVYLSLNEKSNCFNMKSLTPSPSIRPVLAGCSVMTRLKLAVVLHVTLRVDTLRLSDQLALRMAYPQKQ
jgi:hypothetical protein